MRYETFNSDVNFRPESERLIKIADKIIKEYAKQGYTLTLRQLYYQFVARGIIENTERSYKNLGNLVTNGRMAGLLPWDGIEDRNRGVEKWRINEDIPGILEALPRQFAADFWRDQETYVEVWVEKEALSNVVERACAPLRVPFMACKGYLSASEAWRAGKRMELARDDRKRCVIVHLGDHDPSGIDMTRDNQDRLTIFSGWSPSYVEVRRIALTRAQVDQYNPPPNPTKITDSRADDYIVRHGYECWELDALEPQVVVDLITAEIEPMIDQDLWEDARGREAEGQELLRGIGEHWSDIENLIRDLKGM